MVNIDDVYQKVLTLSNKEQRGYITPQEFNLMADRAQKEIYNGYFHDMKTGFFKPKSENEAFDDLEMIQQKLDFHRDQTMVTCDLTTTNDWRSLVTFTMPSTAYKVASLFLKTTHHTAKFVNPAVGGSYVYQQKHYSSDAANESWVEVKRVERNDLLNMLANPLTRPTMKRPVYVNRKNGGNNVFEIYPMATYTRYSPYEVGISPVSATVNSSAQDVYNGTSVYDDSDDAQTWKFHAQADPIDGIGATHNSSIQPTGDDSGNVYEIKGAELFVDYWKALSTPSWGYVVVKQKALYNSSNTTHFSLHPMEEENLVIKILQLAGITIEKPQLTKMAMGIDAKNKQEQND
jgi:hypothetical protein